MAEIKALGKPHVDEESQKNLEEMAAALTQMITGKQLAGMIIIPMKQDGDFRVMMTGNVKRIMAVGYLAQAQFDLLAEKE